MLLNEFDERTKVQTGSLAAALSSVGFLVAELALPASYASRTHRPAFYRIEEQLQRLLDAVGCTAAAN